MYMRSYQYFFFFFFNDTATTEIYTLSLHDALPISMRVFMFQTHREDSRMVSLCLAARAEAGHPLGGNGLLGRLRSEEHTSELQSLTNLVCRLLLEKKKNNISRSRSCCDMLTAGCRH